VDTINFTEITLQINTKLKEKGFKSRIVSNIYDSFNVYVHPHDNFEELVNELTNISEKHLYIYTFMYSKEV